MMEWIENLNQLPLITGSILIVAGFAMYRFPPKKRNMLYGYRTMNSMKSQERWNFSQKFSARELMKFGCFILPFSALGFFNFPEWIVNTIVILALFLPILTTEIALIKKFATPE